MSETIRVYTPPAAGSFDPYTIGITGGIPLFFDTRTQGGGDPTNVIRAVVTTTAGDYAGGGDFRLPPFSFVPNPPGVRTMAGGPQGGTYVANPDGPPARPGTGNFLQDLAAAYNTPGFASNALSLLSGPAAIPSIMAGTALSSFSSDPRVTGIAGGLADLLADATRTPEERAMRSEAAKGFDKEAQREAETRMGITVEDLPAPTLSLSELSNIAATVEPETPATISVPSPEADIGVFGEENDTTTGAPPSTTTPSSPTAPSAPASPTGALASLEANFASLVAALDKQAAEERAMDEVGRAMVEAVNMAAALSDTKGLGNVDQSVPSEDKDAPGIGGEKGAFGSMSAAEAEAAAQAANVDADAGPGGVGGGPGGGPGGSTDSAADSPGAGGGVGADGSVGSGGDAWKKGGLVKLAGGGLVPLAGGGKIAIGPGGGLDDLIPTSINGRRAAALSDGEFVIPADVVSMMGDGSSNAGARRLYDLVKQIRTVKTGTTKQAGPLPVGDILKRSMGR